MTEKIWTISKLYLRCQLSVQAEIKESCDPQSKAELKYKSTTTMVSPASVVVKLTLKTFKRSDAVFWRVLWSALVLVPEPILPIRRIRKLCRAPEPPGAPLLSKLISFYFHFRIWSTAMKTQMTIYCNAVLSPFLCKNQSNHVTWMS